MWFLIIYSCIVLVGLYGWFRWQRNVNIDSQIRDTLLKENIMAHDIKDNDGLVLFRDHAWHGLGTIVQDAPTPQEALVLAGLNWEVYQAPLVALYNDDPLVESHVLNYRSDDNSALGVVGKGYTPVQNSELAAFAEALGQTGDVRVETMGSIEGGRKVWTLIKGDTIDIDGDLSEPYLLIANGHDGSIAFRIVPTTIRVVCKNTLNAVIPLGRSGGRIKKCVFSCRHTGGILANVEEAKRALHRYTESIDATTELCNTLAARDVSVKDISNFWLDVYQRQFTPVPINPIDGTDTRRRERATAAFERMSHRFDTEPGEPSLWKAFNAYTGWLQHDYRSLDSNADKRNQTNLFGINSDRTVEALSLALNYE